VSESEYERVVKVHYDNKEVQEEIAKFSKDRWIAVHCEQLNPQGYNVLLRYRKGAGKTKAPLTITKPEDVPMLLKRFERLRPRTFYASVNVYKELSTPEHVKALGNIVSCAPTWDIDNAPEKWKATIEVAREILAFLSEEGLSQSTFLKWSGKGAHVHVHQKAFSPNLLRKIAPLDAAYAVVEYANRALRPRFARIAEAHRARELSVENEIDLQRVFTCPLSLHRSLRNVAVCIAPDSMDDFTPDWTKVESFRHWKGWDRCKVGEADAVAEKAYRLVGGYPGKAPPKTKPKEAPDSITKWLKNA